MKTSPCSTRRRPNRWTEVFSNSAAVESFHLEAPAHPDPEKGAGGDRGGIDISAKRDEDRGGGGDVEREGGGGGGSGASEGGGGGGADARSGAAQGGGGAARGGHRRGEAAGGFVGSVSKSVAKA